MKIISCLIIASLAEASFIIQKTPAESRKSRASKSPATTQSQRHGISVLSYPVNNNSNIDGNRKSTRGHSVSRSHGKSVASRSSYGVSEKASRKSRKTRGHSSTSASSKHGKYKRAVVNKSADRAVSSSKFTGANSFTFSQQNRISGKSPRSLSPGISLIKPAKSSPKFAASKTKSAQNVTIDDFVYVTLPLNQWTEFYFSEVGQLPYSRWTFDIPASQKCSLQVVDAYCTGDRFEAVRRLDSGVEVPLLSTPVVPFNPVIAEQIRLGGNVNCTPFTTDPATAWASSSWSKGQVALTQSGNYKLILKSLLAPYGSGGAYVRLNCEDTPTPTPTPSSVCSYGSSSIKYIRQTLPFTQQAAVCQSFGFRPIDITQANIQDARSVLLNCAGLGTRAWIASYNGDNYRGSVGLALHASQLTEVGAITATPDNSPLEGVLCQ